MKKTIIICSSIIFVSISSLTLFLILFNNGNSASADAQLQMNGQNLMSMITEDMTYEEFSESFQDGLSDETLSEAESLFSEIKEAMSSEDTETLSDLLIQINSLNLFEQSGNMQFGPGSGDSGFDITDIVGGSDQNMPQGGGPGQRGEMPGGGGN